MAFFCALKPILWISLVIVTSSANGMVGQEHATTQKHFTGTIGGTTSFECLVKFHGLHKVVTWEFNYDPVYIHQQGVDEYPRGQKKYLVIHDDSIFTLTVHNLDLDDVGNYKCIVADVTETGMQLVLGPPVENVILSLECGNNDSWLIALAVTIANCLIVTYIYMRLSSRLPLRLSILLGRYKTVPRESDSEVGLLTKKGDVYSPHPEKLAGSGYTDTGQYNDTKQRTIPHFDSNLKDLLPVGNIAEGLAWAYYFNFIKLIGSNVEEKIRKFEVECKITPGSVPRKIFILMPFSCCCYPRLEDADPAITFKKSLDLLTKQIAGNVRMYDPSVHIVKLKGQKYYLSAEYCASVQVLYEIAVKGVAHFSLEEKRYQLLVFYHVLKAILEHPDAPQFCQRFKLVLFDDKGDKQLSQILVEQVTDNLVTNKHV